MGARKRGKVGLGMSKHGITVGRPFMDAHRGTSSTHAYCSLERSIRGRVDEGSCDGYYPRDHVR